MLDFGQVDRKRVDEFYDEFMKLTGHLLTHAAKRTRELDQRISTATLGLADKIEVIRRLAPRSSDRRLGAVTDERKELRMERLFLSVGPKDLPLFKFALEYDGGYKDLEEYIFHDIDKRKYRSSIIEHFNAIQREIGFIGVKVLSDVDDTMYANLIDERYPKKTLYPGVLDFYDSLQREPFKLKRIPLTALSARPNPIAGKLEEASLKSLVEFTKQRLCPSALSGSLVSSVVGTVETVLRANLEFLSDDVPHGKEDKIGRVKFDNFSKFSEIYPEYRYVFVGDSGQADALTAQLMVTDGSIDGTKRVVATFIHDLRQSDNDAKSVSPAFKKLPRDIVAVKTNPATGRGVIVFRNYIDAATIAYTHSAFLVENLITAEKLARITRVALQEFQDIDFQGKEASAMNLREQYRQDAEEAFKLLTAAPAASSPQFEEDVTEIRRVLDQAFRQRRLGAGQAG